MIVTDFDKVIPFHYYFKNSTLQATSSSSSLDFFRCLRQWTSFSLVFCVIFKSQNPKFHGYRAEHFRSPVLNKTFTHNIKKKKKSH